MLSLTGWLFDVYAAGDDVTVWVMDADGLIYALRDELHPSFFVGGPERELGGVCRWLAGARLSVRLKEAHRGLPLRFSYRR